MNGEIVPMGAGQKPTERGWYVMLSGPVPVIVEVDPGMNMVWYSGVSGTDPIGDQIFIAQIFPDVIHRRAQALSELAQLDGELL